MAVVSYDLKVDNDGNLEFSSDGDFIVTSANTEHSKAILLSNPGDWKQYPFLGVGLRNEINSPLSNRVSLQNTIKRQFSNDGFDIQDLSLDVDRLDENLILKTNAIRRRL